MKKSRTFWCLMLLSQLLVTVAVIMASGQNRNAGMPTLQKQGTATQLIVAGAPFLVLGGETGNSSASDMRYMKPIWNKMQQLHCNTVLAPIYWEIFEPRKGEFDYSIVDSLILNARKNNMKIVFLWFGSWKNSMSCYVPAWVKRDHKYYPRAYDQEGVPQEILTPFSENNLKSDMTAFVALMNRIREIDEKEQTVIMVQVENEIGMLPTARDYHPDATRAFNQPVPRPLIEHLQKNSSNLAAGLRSAWEKNGSRTNGTWEEVFGKGLATDEYFIAWYFAAFTNKIAEAGKQVYPLPMFANAALNRPGVKPGDYPSGGPLPHLIDIWKAAAPALDFLSPDFYNPNFKHWNDLYTRPDNPLFIPEIRFEPAVAAKVFYAIGHYHAIGFSPFSIESTDAPTEEPLSKSYQVLGQLSPIISRHQGKKTMDGVLLDKNTLADTLHFGSYQFIIRHDYTLGWSPGAKEDRWPESGGLVIQTAPDEFLLAGTGIVVTFSSVNKADGRTGILTIEEGHFENGDWVSGRIMNGDQSHQGRHLRIPVGDYGIQKLTLYKYK